MSQSGHEILVLIQIKVVLTIAEYFTTEPLQDGLGNLKHVLRNQ